MIPLSNPILLDYLQAARGAPRDPALVLMFYDRLAESLGHFVGEEGGASLGDACWWYAKGADEDEPALREALATMDGMTPASVGNVLQFGDRPARVRAMEPRLRGRIFDPWEERSVRKEWTESTKAVVCRDLRRRVLALYPEVKYRFQVRLSEETIKTARSAEGLSKLIRLHLTNAGFRLDVDGIGEFRHSINCEENLPDLCWVYTQTLHAPDLIPPEPESPAVYRRNNEVLGFVAEEPIQVGQHLTLAQRDGCVRVGDPLRDTIIGVALENANSRGDSIRVDIYRPEYGPPMLQNAWPSFQAGEMMRRLFRDDGPVIRDPGHFIHLDPDDRRTDHRTRVLDMQRFLNCTCDPEPPEQVVNEFENWLLHYPQFNRPSPHEVADWLRGQGFRLTPISNT